MRVRALRESGSPSRILAAARALGLGALILGAAGLWTCAPRKAPPGPPEFPFALTGQVDLILGKEGLGALPKASPPILEPGLQASLALRVAALSGLGPKSGLILAALNRYGLGLLELAPDRSAFKVRSIPRPEIAGQTVAALWPRDSAWLLELYRDPFVQPSQVRSDQDPELLTVDAAGQVAVLPRLGNRGEDLFALFPGPKARWYAEFRVEGALGSRLRYASLDSPEPGPDGRVQGLGELRKDLFEASLAPRPLSAAPATLRRAAQAIVSGPILVRARGEDGRDGFWLSSGRAEDAAEAWAWVGLGEDSALVILRSGLGAWATKDGLSSFQLSPALAGAEYGPVVALFAPPGGPGRTVLASAWTLGQFPEVSASGLSVLALEPQAGKP